MGDLIAIIDFGSQTSQLIARRVREAQVYCELFPYDAPAESILSLEPSGYILSGGPASIYEEGAPRIPDFVIESGQPILGICYGMQALADTLGGKVAPADSREYGSADAQYGLASAAGASVVGIGTLIEKQFEGGRELLGRFDVPIEALAVITEMSEGKIVFEAK